MKFEQINEGDIDWSAQGNMQSICNISIKIDEFVSHHGLIFNKVQDSESGLGDAIISLFQIKDFLFCLGARETTVDRGVELTFYGDINNRQKAFDVFQSIFSVDRSNLDLFSDWEKQK